MKMTIKNPPSEHPSQGKKGDDDDDDDDDDQNNDPQPG